MSVKQNQKAELYTKYPLSNVIIYNGTTIAHYIIGGACIILGYNFSPLMANLFGAFYLIFSFTEMYLVMPLTVCPHCVYYKLKNSLCISGLNVFSKRITKIGSPDKFSNRAKGIFCFNNMYISALVLPILATIPALIINYSLSLLLLFLSMLALIVYRFFILFVKIACIHCRAKYKCPQAGQMGVRDL